MNRAQLWTMTFAAVAIVILGSASAEMNADLEAAALLAASSPVSAVQEATPATSYRDFLISYLNAIGPDESAAVATAVSPTVSIANAPSATPQYVVAGGPQQVLGAFTISTKVVLRATAMTFKVSVSGRPANSGDITDIHIFPMVGGKLLMPLADSRPMGNDEIVLVPNNTWPFIMGSGVTYVIAGNLSSNFKDGQRIQISANPWKSDWQVFPASGNTKNPVSFTKSPVNLNSVTVRPITLSVSLAPSSPAPAMAVAGTPNVTLGVLNFRASVGSVRLQRISFQLSSGNPSDVGNLTLWDDSGQIGQAFFTGTNKWATTTLVAPVVIQKDTTKQIIVKVNLNPIGSGQPVTESGHSIKIGVVGPMPPAEGTGVESGTTVLATGSAVFSGIRVMKSMPVVSLDTLPGNGVADGRLLRFKITATPTGPIGVGLLQIHINSQNAKVRSANVYAFTDAQYSQPVAGFGPGGQLLMHDVDLVGASQITFVLWPKNASTTVPLEVPAGVTLFFEVRGLASTTANSPSYSIVTSLLGDSRDSPMRNASPSFGAFEWSPNTLGISSLTDTDWTNGYGVPGLPASGIMQTRTN